MSNYEYLGKKEIYKRVHALGYEVPKISDFSYIKYDCIEWMESHKLKITVQRGGGWLQVVEKRARSPGRIVLRLSSRGIYYTLPLGIFLYPFLACQKSSVQPLELSQVIRLCIRAYVH